MAEEVQATQNPEAPAGDAAAKGKKTKKINRMTAKELAAKIENIESGKMAGSKYYKHLLQRKAELEPKQQG